MLYKEQQALSSMSKVSVMYSETQLHTMTLLQSYLSSYDFFHDKRAHLTAQEVA